MLMLNRKNGESILFTGGIEVIIISADYNRVRIGIEAPSEITILRKELHERDVKEKLEKQMDILNQLKGDL